MEKIVLAENTPHSDELEEHGSWAGSMLWAFGEERSPCDLLVGSSSTVQADLITAQGEKRKDLDAARTTWCGDAGAAAPWEIPAAALNLLDGEERERSEGDGNTKQCSPGSLILVKRVHQIERGGPDSTFIHESLTTVDIRSNVSHRRLRERQNLNRLKRSKYVIK